MAVAFAIVSQPRETNQPDPPVLTGNQKRALENHEAFVQQKINEFVDDYFKRFDANANGAISQSEFPRSIRDHGIWQIDGNRDRVVTREEVIQLAEQHFRDKYPFSPLSD